MRWTLAILGFLISVAGGCAQKETDITEAAPSSTIAPAATDLTTTAPPTGDTAAPPAGTGTATAAGETRPVPPTHTVDHGGIMHAPGSDEPARNCASCHGQDLGGGRVASSSCLDCHEKVWN